MAFATTTDFGNGSKPQVSFPRWLQFLPHKMRPAQGGRIVAIKAKFITTWSTVKSNGDHTASAFGGFDIRT